MEIMKKTPCCGAAPSWVDRWRLLLGLRGGGGTPCPACGTRLVPVRGISTRASLVVFAVSVLALVLLQRYRRWTHEGLSPENAPAWLLGGTLLLAVFLVVVGVGLPLLPRYRVADGDGGEHGEEAGA